MIDVTSLLSPFDSGQDPAHRRVLAAFSVRLPFAVNLDNLLQTHPEINFHDDSGSH